MGFRKATNTVSLPDSQISAIANGSLLSETLFSTANDNLGVVSGYPGFLQSIKGAADLHPSSLYDHHMNSADGDVSWLKADKFSSRPDEGSLQFLQKRSRNIGSKSRRFLIDAEDAMELKLTWEEAQELLRPAPTAKPTIVMIEDYDLKSMMNPLSLQRDQFSPSVQQGNKINGFNVTIARNGVGCLLLLLLLPNGHALKTHGTQKVAPVLRLKN